MSPFRNRARPIFVWCSISRTPFGGKVADCQIQLPTDCKHGVRSVTLVTNVKFHSQYVPVCTPIIYVAYMKSTYDSCIACEYEKYREKYTHILNYWYNIQKYIHTHARTHTHTHTLFWIIQNISKVKVKQSHYRPWEALRVLGVWSSQILRQSAHEGSKVVNPKHRLPLLPANIPGTHFC
jgi:hypothetical protein